MRSIYLMFLLMTSDMYVGCITIANHQQFYVSYGLFRTRTSTKFIKVSYASW